MKAGFYRKTYDFLLLFIIIALLGFGLLVLASSSIPRSNYDANDSMAYMLSQGKFALIGLVIMFAASFVDYHFYKHIGAILIWACSAMNFFASVWGLEINGAKRWICIGSRSNPIFTFQPSELLKVAVIVYFASVFSDESWGERAKGGWSLITVFLPLGVSLASVLFQKHISATIIIFAIALIIMIVGGIKFLLLVIVGGLGAALGGAVLLIKPKLMEHVGARFKIYANTVLGNIKAENLDEQYLQQIQNSIYAIGSGGFLGRGYGKSIQKYSYLPEAYNDFIFAILAEELGFVGVVLAIVLFIMLVWRITTVAIHCRDKFGSLLAVGIAAMVGIQTFLNIAVVSCVVPVTGVGLPFFSSGGTSLIIMMGLMGIALNIAKQSDYSKIKGFV